MFNSAKQIRYQWFLEDPNGEINMTKVEIEMKFNKCYNIFNYFLLKDNELYCQVLKVEQSKRLVMCNYSDVDIVEKVYI